MSRDTVTVELDWEHALMLPQLLDLAVLNEKRRLANMKSPRWQQKTEAKIRAGEHVAEQVRKATIEKITPHL